jgi:hypothetical protein
VLVGVAVAAVAFAIAEGDDEQQPASADRRAEREPPVQPAPRPSPPRRRPRPPARPRDRKGYPEGTEDRFVSICEEQTPLDEDACGCVYDRLHDEYSYEEFRRLIGEIDAERRRVPPEILEHVLRCRLP